MGERTVRTVLTGMCGNRNGDSRWWRRARQTGGSNVLICAADRAWLAGIRRWRALARCPTNNAGEAVRRHDMRASAVETSQALSALNLSRGPLRQVWWHMYISLPEPPLCDTISVSYRHHARFCGRWRTAALRRLQTTGWGILRSLLLPLAVTPPVPLHYR